MDKYEYKLLTVSVAHLKKTEFQSELQTKFDQWGEQGWELDKMEPVTEGFIIWPATTKFLVVFKRPK